MKYWDRAWSLVEGCTPCSPGCDHCWLAGMKHRFEYGECSDEWTFTNRDGGFKGRIYTCAHRLDIPLRRKKPTVWAIWSDLFHEDVPLSFIDDALEVMAACPQHTFLILTKRAHLIEHKLYGQEKDYHMRELGGGDYLPNVWIGVTVCNQEEADIKIPQLLHSGWHGKRFLSIEPMLGPIERLFNSYAIILEQGVFFSVSTYARIVDAVIFGGETGPGARPMHPDWVRSVRDQCAAVGVPFLFKGWGAWAPHCICIRDIPHATIPRPGYPLGVMFHCRKGRLLDGRTHDDMPWRTHGV
jgi:protein gp37